MTAHRACLTLALVLGASLAGCRSTDVPRVTRRPPADDPLVDLERADPRLSIALVYATPDNFTGEVLYDEPRALLRRSAQERLSRAQDRFDELGLRLVVLDAYRPHSVQQRLWAILPDPSYVADPTEGSRHGRGMAVDVTLADASGRALEMPTAYDHFGPEAAADWPAASAAAGENRELLIEVMESVGFRVLASEWWHFDAEGWEKRMLLDVPFDRVRGDPSPPVEDRMEPMEDHERFFPDAAGARG